MTITEPVLDARERLIHAAQSLYARQGVDATTPRQVIAESGVGQGSLYHHFPSKHDLAVVAVTRSADETLARARDLLESSRPPGPARSAQQRIRAWLVKPRNALAGCRIGRLTSDPVVMSDVELHAPVGSYFTGLLDLLAAAFVESGASPERAATLAATVAAVVQGGYVLARATGDAGTQDRAIVGLLDLLDVLGGDPLSGPLDGDRLEKERTMTEATRAWLRERDSFPVELPEFEVESAPDDPVELFLDWLRAAVESGVLAAHGGVLSTSDATGVVSGRILVLKDVEPGAWRVATPTDGQAGSAAGENPHAALTFFWPALGRQVKASGSITAESRERAVADFLARPLPARVTTLVGRPSAELSGATEYAAARADAEARIDAEPDLVPEDWAVWRLEPTSVEFWQAAHSREHIRLRYLAGPDGWSRGLLWP